MNEKLSQQLFLPSFLLALASAVFILVCASWAVVEAARVAIAAQSFGLYAVLSVVFLMIVGSLWFATFLSLRELLRISWWFWRVGRSALRHRGGTFRAALFCGAAPLAVLVMIAWGFRGISNGIDPGIQVALRASVLCVLPLICHLAAELALGPIEPKSA